MQDQPCRSLPRTANAYALCLIDTAGRHRLLYADRKLSCWHPTPLIARPVPPQVQSVRDPRYAARNQALCILADVYQGMEGVKARRSQMAPHQRSPAAVLVHGPALGAVAEQFQLEGRPLAARAMGSGARRKRWFGPFCGAGRPQHLLSGPGRKLPGNPAGADVRELHAGRGSFLHGLPRTFQPCRLAPRFRDPAGFVAGRQAYRSRNRAIKKPMAEPASQARSSITPADIQPIFNAKCVSCHGVKDPAGGLTADGRNHALLQHFLRRTRHEGIGRSASSPNSPRSARATAAITTAHIYLPAAWGVPHSHVIGVLTNPADAKNAKDDHCKMLSAMELMILCRWVDSNYQFYGSYFGRQHPQWVNADPGNRPTIRPISAARRPSTKLPVSWPHRGTGRRECLPIILLRRIKCERIVLLKRMRTRHCAFREFSRSYAYEC